ncbi:outer membrane protein [Cognatishimia activa]|uniref:outer membrane protein n=1 Tax=Cognatishimia activa TaxID=1715691 RepID=UPI002232A2DD|nr:outer membrane beta-barrel protein [Cognatishimia activa]UZD90606.1 outer membrane beta-barrel protein [Cognatishimia activa]
MRNLGVTALFAAVILANPAAAEMEVSFYMGTQSSPHAVISGTLDGTAGTAVDRTVAWEGRSFTPPPYYGVRGVYWRESGWGYGLELTHAKVYASDADRTALGLDSLEFTDGHNIITANIHRRWEDRWWNGRLTPFVTAGLGVAVPHVDIQPTGDAHTFGYQLTGPAARLGVGVSIDLTEKISAFTEYQITYSDNKVELDSGGTLETSLVTNALNFGVSYSF